jgi:sulfur-oxidizing protein SoxY
MTHPASPLPRRRLLRLMGGSALAASWISETAAQPAPRPTPEAHWAQLRPSLFGQREIVDNATNLLALDLPARAEDAAVVPVTMRALVPQTPTRWVRKLHLVIDNNPSPMGAVFSYTPDSGLARIETRVRVEEYTTVRAVAEFNDGRLAMVSRFLKASGGCSAPAGKDMAEAMARLGRMKMRVDGDVVAGQPALAQLMVSHPNVSGLAIDQLTRLAPAPVFVRRVAVSYAGRPVLQADVDFSLSENPSLRFNFLAQRDGELVAEVSDTDGRSFTTRLQVREGAQGAA